MSFLFVWSLLSLLLAAVNFSAASTIGNKWVPYVVDNDILVPYTINKTTLRWVPENNVKVENLFSLNSEYFDAETSNKAVFPLVAVWTSNFFSETVRDQYFEITTSTPDGSGVDLGVLLGESTDFSLYVPNHQSALSTAGATPTSRPLELCLRYPTFDETQQLDELAQLEAMGPLDGMEQPDVPQSFEQNGEVSSLKDTRLGVLFTFGPKDDIIVFFFIENKLQPAVLSFKQTSGRVLSPAVLLSTQSTVTIEEKSPDTALEILKNPNELMKLENISIRRYELLSSNMSQIERGAFQQTAPANVRWDPVRELYRYLRGSEAQSKNPNTLRPHLTDSEHFVQRTPMSHDASTPRRSHFRERHRKLQRLNNSKGITETQQDNKGSTSEEKVASFGTIVYAPTDKLPSSQQTDATAGLNSKANDNSILRPGPNVIQRHRLSETTGKKPILTLQRIPLMDNDLGEKSSPFQIITSCSLVDENNESTTTTSPFENS